MGRSSFVQPETRTLTLASGATLTVKRHLTAFERRRERAMRAHPTLAEPGLVMAYLLDWSLPEMSIAGKSYEDLGTALDALHDDVFDDIYAAIKAHETAMVAERAAEKNGQGGVTPSPAISPSLVTSAGVLTGSAH
jgi:hypothetical protein